MRGLHTQATIIIGTLGAVLGALVVAAPAGNATEFGAATYSITSEIGVWQRNAAQIGATTGYGPGSDEVVTDLCQVMDGEAVGSYGNRVWHYVARPNGSRTWVPDTYLSTPNDANEATPGTPFCDSPSGDPGVEVAKAQPAWQPNCDVDTPYVSGHISVLETDYGGRMISVPITDAARHPDVTRRQVTNQMWHILQGCVPGLVGDKANNVFWQLSCHEEWSYLEVGPWSLTGDTFDLEDWKPSPGDDRVTQLRHECGNLGD